MRLLTLALIAACSLAQAAQAQPAYLRVAYLHDSERQAAANRAGRNYWNVYTREILDQLGLRADQAAPAILPDPKLLERYATIIIGDLDPQHLSPGAMDNLEKWVRQGGTLITFATEGLHELCGNRRLGLMRQPYDEFTCAATFDLQPHPLTRDIHSPLQPQQKLLIFADVHKVKPEKAVELARLYDRRGQDTGCAAVTMRNLGKGRVCYFAFSVPQTMWVLHHGRPVDRDYDGDNRLRRSDAIVIRPHSIEVAYADEILFLLQNLIGTQPHPFLHQLPPCQPPLSPPSKGGDKRPLSPPLEGGDKGPLSTPLEGGDKGPLSTPLEGGDKGPLSPPLEGGDKGGVKAAIPDALFFWGGDDEGDQLGIQLFASNWLKERGLPYHINAMPRKDGSFGLRAEDARKIRANGHEISLHYNFIDNFDLNTGFTRRDVLNQASAYRKHFGMELICSVNHWTRWYGWTEPAKWMREAGGKADNSFVHAGSPPSNPVNLMGFSSGTAFPFWFHDDWRQGNRKIDFLEQPITAYECGYIGKDKTDFPLVHKIVDLAARYHLTMNIFHHPIYITRYPSCRLAIEEGLRYAKERKIRVLHLGNDAFYYWWKARSEAQISEVTWNGRELSLTVSSDYKDGVIVKVPLGQRLAKEVTCNGAAVKACKNEHWLGQNWAFMVAPRGKVQLRVTVE